MIQKLTMNRDMNQQKMNVQPMKKPTRNIKRVKTVRAEKYA